ncbi:hypothetical protein MUCCIDRAFT_82914 [Mucor lusitanicus CBS 277.49]|uniref:GPI-GlcNAc transferase complex PIG-H component conserved domain-containing protein n=1 Tax=Mucor lusitanicus CBS 277.49 TaxID=747725 RepID=A0A162T7J6_MUCCL|nr:hypothetical protein MUCCIDRAFT_82914 [Mucor lusitanicus CBS 277.49]
MPHIFGVTLVLFVAVSLIHHLTLLYEGIEVPLVIHDGNALLFTWMTMDLKIAVIGCRLEAKIALHSNPQIEIHFNCILPSSEMFFVTGSMLGTLFVSSTMTVEATIARAVRLLSPT